jgi:hypothetical protein
VKTWGDKRPDPAFSAIASRAVLRDAHVALKDFADALIDSDAARIRIRWLNCLALLRTIGHVLKDVDRDRSVWMAAAVDQKHREVMQNEFANLIFHEFIKKERDAILKEYRASIFMWANGKLMVCDVLVGTDLYSPDEVIKEALSYWEKYLSDVETLALRGFKLDPGKQWPTIR